MKMGRRAREENGTWVPHDAASEKEEGEESLAYFKHREAVVT
jgi:hypothetical protein